MSRIFLRFLTLILGASVAVIAANAESPKRILRVGFLSSLEPEASLDPFREGLRNNGYLEGQNVAIEARLAIRDPARLAELAKDLARAGVDVIVAGGSDATQAAQRATSTIPIVSVSVADPIGAGIVRNFARPEGNITGPAGMSADQGAKRIQLIRELLPQATRVIVLVHSRNPSHASMAASLSQSAQRVGLIVYKIDVGVADDIEKSFAAMVKINPHALVVLPDNMFFNQRDRIVRLASMHRLPDVYWRRECVEAGGLISVGADNTALYRRAATYVDRIFKGAKPADLPMELPSKFEIFANLKTAMDLGLKIPESVLIQLDKTVH